MAEKSDEERRPIVGDRSCNISPRCLSLSVGQQFVVAEDDVVFADAGYQMAYGGIQSRRCVTR